MYAAVGSYMARVIRIFDMRFAPYPPFADECGAGRGDLRQLLRPPLCLPDARYVLMAADGDRFIARTRVWFTINRTAPTGCRCRSRPS